MLDCQLLTNGIIWEELVEVLGQIPRESFLPEDKRGVAYLDEDLPLDNDCFCMEPLIQARLIQGLAPDADSAVLNIGDMTGYASAIMSGLSSTVVTLESVTGTLDHARGVWDELGCCNVVVVNGVTAEGSPDHAPYDRIIINGAVPEIPETLLNQLADGGRLAAVVMKPGQSVGCITIMQKIGEGQYSSDRLFDASTFYVPGFAPETSFVF